MAEASRVALLARPGEARDRLQAALQEAGAELVLVADPTTAEAGDVRAAGAQAVLVALEPQVEDALDRFDAVLGDPAVTVIFDEAELAARRDGWDAARWVRHLAVKLGRRDDVLPPGFEPDEMDTIDERLGAELVQPERYRRQDTDLEFSSFAAEAAGLTDEVPTAALDEDAPRHWDSGPDLDLSAFAAEAASLAGAVPEDGLEGGTVPVGNLQFTDDLGEATPDFDNFSFDLDLSALDAALAATPVPEPEPVPHADFDIARDEPPPPPPRPSRPAVLELAPDTLPVDDKKTDDRFRLDLAELEARIADLRLVDEPRVRPSNAPGVVLVLAGIGGPDAVRQLLGGLPASFPRAVLVEQRLNGGRHDKLVRQMQRATSLPVMLAEDGMEIVPGKVYVLPGDLGLAPDEPLRFGGAAPGLLTHLPANDSAIVLLSGSDPAVVDAAMAHALRGALVVGQAPDGCYDATAPAELIARGADSGAPPALAKKLAARWAA
ncbi:MAG: chemotaxis protein CheB [Lysobacteraceae bacterium]